MELIEVIPEIPDSYREPYPGAYYDMLEQLAYEAGWYSPMGKRRHISGLVVNYLVPQIPFWDNP